MPTISECLDKNGKTIGVGSSVRIISLSETFLASLPVGELQDVRSMLGEVFKVHEIDEYGCPWVQKEWGVNSTDCRNTHALALDASEIELVDANAV